MTCEARRLLFDYYREKPRKSCPARLPRFFLKMPEICARPIKALRRRAFRLDGLITPTLKAAGSNPVGHTKKALKPQWFQGFLILRYFLFVSNELATASTTVSPSM